MDFILIGDSWEVAKSFAEQYSLKSDDEFCYAEQLSLYAFSVMLTDFMLGKRMEYKINLLAEKRLPSLAQDDKKMLISRTMELLNHEDFCWGIFAGRGRYAKMRTTIENCLRSCYEFNCLGFERFRMRGLEEYLAAVMSVALQEIMFLDEEKEYYALLNDFMQKRKCGYDSVRLILRANGNYLLQGKCEYGMMSLEGGHVSGYMDMIITSLLCLAPQILEIEQEKSLPQYKILLNGLRRIFGSKMTMV